MNPIIKLTPNAIVHIKKAIDQIDAVGFRLAVKKTGCSGYAYVADIVKGRPEQDTHFEVDNITIFVPQDSIKFLQDTVVDYIDHGLGQSKMVFHNPNAANQCGCGESFNLAEE